MPSTDRAGLPYPSGADTPYAAADMQALAEGVDSRVVLRALDAADRDARYPNPEVGMVVAAQDGTIWVAIQGGTWLTAHQEPEQWRQIPIPSNLESLEPPQVRRIGSQVWIRGYVGQAGGGSIDGVLMGTLPLDCRPSRQLVVTAAADPPSSGDYASIRLRIYENGEIRASLVPITPTISPEYVYLDGLSFWID